MIIASPQIISQNEKKYTVQSEENIYLNLKEENSELLIGNQRADNFKPLKDVQILALKKEDVNFFIKWLNPLTNKIEIKDSLFIDPRDKVIQDYIEKILAQFNAPISDSLKNPKTVFSACTLQSFTFKRNDLLEIFELGKANIDGSENIYCDLFNILLNVEARNISGNAEKIKEIRKSLISISESENVEPVSKTQESKIDNISSSYKMDFFALIQLEQFLSQRFLTTNQLLKNKLELLFNKEYNLLEQNKKHILKLAEYIAILRKSIENESSEKKGYFLLKMTELPEGQENLATVTKTVMKFDESKNEFIEESSKKNQFRINKYDFIVPKVGTGLFYASTTLTSFGVSTNENGELTVSENDIEKSTAVTGLFLNLNIDIKSRYLMPVIQIGIDPTKTRPFFLLGGGFSIASSNFSLTGGPIWTWKPILQKLSVGDKVESSTIVENDISYSFDVKPKGYYLGISYNF